MNPHHETETAERSGAVLDSLMSCVASGPAVQGYLAHKKPRFPRRLDNEHQSPAAERGGAVLDSLMSYVAEGPETGPVAMCLEGLTGKVS